MFGQFKQRSKDLERLDTGDYTPEEYLRWQREMRLIHRVFGEIRALRNSLLPIVRASGESKVSILDVGAGSGELLRAVRKWLGEKATLVGVEINVDAAKAIGRGDGNLNALRADALRLPFADNSFDHAFCSLFLHHLTDVQAVAMLHEMSRVAKKRIFVIDLRRSPVAYYFFRFTSRLFLQRFTSEDGSLSILRSFTPVEMRQLAEKAGLVDIEVKRSWAYRLVLSGS